MTFVPAPGLRNPHVNTILASTAPRRWWQGRLNRPIRAGMEEVILECSDGVRLHGEYLPNVNPSQGLVILLHGLVSSAGLHAGNGAGDEQAGDAGRDYH